MDEIGQPERTTQNRVVALFREELGFRYLGDWTDRPNNSSIEVALLTAFLARSGYSPAQNSRALDLLHTEADNPNRSLYDPIKTHGRPLEFDTMSAENLLLPVKR